MKKKLFVLMVAMVTAACSVTGCGLGDFGITDVKSDDDSSKKDKEDDKDKKDDKTGDNGNQKDDSRPMEQNGNTSEGNGSEAANDETDYEVVYRDILDKLYRVAANPGVAEYDDEDGSFGLMEAVMYADDSLNAAGYAFIDLNNDGVNEMIVADMKVSPYGGASGNRIIAVYSCAAQTSMCLLEGWARNSYYLLDNNILYNHGSNSAVSTGSGTLKINKSGTGIEWIDFYYTDFAPNGESIAVYYNNQGVWDTNDNYLSDMTEDEYYTYDNNKLSETVKIELKPFAEYNCSQNVADGMAWSSPIYPVYAEYLLEGEAADAEFILDDDEYSCWVSLYANNTVTDFYLLDLNNVEYFSDGSLSYVSEEITHFNALRQGSTIAVKMTLPETAPYYAMSYYDPDGIFRSYAFVMSGEDGSVALIDLNR